MNRSSEREARLDAGGGPMVVDLRDRVLGMENAALATLHANAQRLQASGDTKQKLAAADLLPVIEAELARRAALKRPRSSAKSAAAKAATAKAPAAARKTKASRAKAVDADAEESDED